MIHATLRGLASALAAPALSIGLSLGLAACGGSDDPGPEVPVASVSVSPKTVTLAVGASRELVETVLPPDATNRDTHWESSDENVAILSLNASNNVEVTGVSAGTAIVTVRTDSGGKTDTCAVTVTASSGPATVYVAGNVGIRTSDDSRAMLWINGSPQQLSSTVSYANSVCVAGGNVYVAGWTGHYDDAPGDRRATLWTNGVPTQLSDTLSSAYSVFVSGGNVYVAGAVGNYGTGSARATLWTNGNAQQLSAGLSVAESVYVSGGVVYVAGHGSPSDKALYWRNGVATQLGTHAGMALAICVSGSTVYVGGSEVVSNTSQPATLWTNGSGQRFDSDLHYGFFEGIFVSGGSLYGAGAVSNMSEPDDLKGRAFLLSNGAAQVISDKPSWAHSVYASGDDVYVSFAEWGADSGSERAMLWKNGVATQLSDSASDARCVFVAQ